MPHGNGPKPGSFPGTFGASDENAEGEGRKALIVDDYPDLLDMAAHLFGLLGFEVLTASNGALALEILKQEPDISVLFSDIVMPGMNGVELGHQAIALIPSLKVILVSGFPDVPEGVLGRIHDFPFITKPYHLAEIQQALEADE